MLWLDADEDLREIITTAEEFVVEGRRYRRLDQSSSATYHGRWGSHPIEESLYREVGVHNGPTIKPIELRVGIIEHMTPDMARIVGELSADKSSRGVERTLRVTGLVPPSRAFLAKHTTEMGIEIADQAAALEQVARTTEIVPAEVAAISTGLDRRSARISEPVDPATAVTPQRTEPYERTPPPPKEHHYRKAWVGSTSVFHYAMIAEDVTDLPARTIARTIRNQHPDTVVLTFLGPADTGRVELVETHGSRPLLQPFHAAQQLIDRLDELAEAWRIKARERRYAQAFREKHYDFLRRYVELKTKIDRAIHDGPG